MITQKYIYIYLHMVKISAYLLISSFCFKYLSIGHDLERLTITYSHLKVIELYQVSFEDMKEILVVLRLITSSPNLEELHISVSLVISVFICTRALVGETLICFHSYIFLVSRDPQTL